MSDTNQNSMSHYLTFQLGNEVFAVHVKSILKILEMQNITEVPRSPAYMKGLINLHGNVLPVIDARLKFGMAAGGYTEKTCILVLNIAIDQDVVEVGAIVDAVMDVMEFPDQDIKPSPSLGSKYKSDFIEGVMKVDERFIMVLNMDSVFSTEEIIDLKEVQGEPN